MQTNQQTQRFPKSIAALKVALRLDYQHKRWLLAKFPDYEWKKRERARRKRQKQIVKMRKREAFQIKYPWLVRLGDLFAIAFTVVVIVGVIWFVHELAASQPRRNVTRSEEDDAAMFDLVLGWLPMAILTAHLFFLYVFDVDPLKGSSVPVRHEALKPRFHFFALIMSLIYVIPVSLVATSVVAWCSAMMLNFVVLFAVSSAVQQASIELISRRSVDALHDEKKRALVVFTKACAAMLVMIGAFFCFAIIHRTLVPGQVPSPPIRFFQRVATGEASLVWNVGLFVSSLLVLMVSWRWNLRHKRFDARRRIVRGIRFDAKVPLDALRNLANVEEKSSNVDLSEAITNEFKSHRSKLDSSIGRLLRFDSILLIWAPVFLIFTVCVGKLFAIMNESDAEVLQSAGIPELELILGLGMVFCWGAVEAAEWTRARSRLLRSSESRLLSTWQRWLRLQADGVATLIQSFVLASPLIGVVCYQMGINAVSSVGFALGVLVLLQFASRTVSAAFSVLSQVTTLLPKLPNDELTGFLILSALVGALLGIAYVVSSFGATGLVYGAAGIAVASLFFFAVSIGLRYHVSQPCH